MSLEYYPLDRQTCLIDLASCKKLISFLSFVPIVFFNILIWIFTEWCQSVEIAYSKKKYDIFFLFTHEMWPFPIKMLTPRMTSNTSGNAISPSSRRRDCVRVCPPSNCRMCWRTSARARRTQVRIGGTSWQESQIIVGFALNVRQDMMHKWQKKSCQELLSLPG